ncbi:hypothetical protein [Luteolibacter soli]|uniref:Uncharacterized protein n=1 Tax=Luteolibacter soli TaxID=3135280 RepID=A0ABU9ARA3_9BACT
MSDDKSEVLIARLAEIKKPEGFQAHIGELIKFKHTEFFSKCTQIIHFYLTEDNLHHDERWPKVGLAEIDKKPRDRKLAKYLKKFKILHAVTGGYNPQGITIIGENAVDEIRFTFQGDESAELLHERFKFSLEKCHWWEPE